jgi:hypothetical protein
MVSSIALAALAAAHGAAPQSSGVKWVPLQQANQQQAAVAQATAQPAPMPGPAPAATRILPAATMISLTALQEISSKHINQGDRFQFAVVGDITEHGVVVIPRGSIATGVISMKTGRAVGGKSGKFDISFENVTANGVRFPLSGIHHQEGKGNTVGALFGSIIISGHSAVVQPGQVLTAFTKEPTAY